jgi:hypothetical protein
MRRGSSLWPRKRRRRQGEPYSRGGRERARGDDMCGTSGTAGPGVSGAVEQGNREDDTWAPCYNVFF